MGKYLRIQNTEFRIQNIEVILPRAYCLLSVAFFCLFFLIPGAAYSRTLVVGTEFKTITEALKKAKAGDIIEVNAGEYRENLRIDKAIQLKGLNNPVIVSNGGAIVEILKPGVTIDGFTIKDESNAPDVRSGGIIITKGADNAVVSNNRIYNAMHAVWSVGARGVRIENNTIVGKKGLQMNYRGNGIYLTGSHEGKLLNNKIEYCRDGFYLEDAHDSTVVGNEVRYSRYAIHTMWVDRSLFNKNTAIDNLVGMAIMYSKQSEIKDNITAGNYTHGLLIIQTTRSQITGNIVIGNTKGMHFYNSVFNNLSSNLIMNNNLGLHNWGGSEDNKVSGNSFVGNEVQVKFVAGRNQQWDGNYWSDYIGWDMTDDGIGDLPYESNTVVDHLLWRYPAAKLLYASPSFQLLWMLEKQFPILKVPRVMDNKPSMLPFHKDWKELKARYPFSPKKYYGEIEKIQVTH